MKILISGSHGLVGSALIKALITDGHEVIRLVRHARNVGAAEIEWQPDKGLIDKEHLEGMDAVIHLAGENIAEGRWTSEKKRAIRDSRIQGTALLSETLATLRHPPTVFLSASAIGYYGNRGDELLTETSTPGDDFLAHVCQDWEKATAPATEKGIRSVLTRFGIILAADGGALAKMLTPFRMGIGGRIANGKQWMSWIALDDVVGAIRFMILDHLVNGPVNFVAPFPVTNAEFTKTLGSVLSRPTFLPVPAFGVRLAFGEMADSLLLASQKVEPTVLKARGFAFNFATLEPALKHILHREYMKQIALLSLILLLLVSSVHAQQHADLILHNGVIWTVDKNNSTAEAVAIKDGKFVTVGSNAEAMKLRGPSTRMIDLRGRFVVPGFNDNHVHFASAAQFLEFNIMRASTQDQFVARVKDVISRLPKGEWIVGGYWGAYDEWAAGSAGNQRREPFAPDMNLVTTLTSDYPMFIRKFDDSQFAANQAAFRALKLDLDNPQAPDVEFLKDSQGRPTGHMRGKGVTRLFNSAIPRNFLRERRIQQTKNALAEIRKYGVTNVSDMSDDVQLDIYRELHRTGDLTVRIHFRPGLDRWKEMADRGIKVGSGDEWIRLGALKGHIDGIMGTSSARFFEPYSNDPNNRGRWRPLMVNDKGEFVEGKFLRYMLDADRAGLQITVHAIGDEANNVLLNYLEELNKQNGKRDRRFRLVHAQVLAPADFKRLGQLGVVAEVQPFHLSDDMRWMEERIGRERTKGAYAFKSIQASGAVLCFGTDWPGTSASEYPINPMLGLYAAVTRQTVTGNPPEGWFPDERISIAEAIKAYTYNTAYANFEETTKGSIEVGKLADLTVLSKNLLKIAPREYLTTDVVYTIVGGRVVYELQNKSERMVR